MNVISLSGGKDSTAMLLLLLERGEKIGEVLFFDSGWEFPQMYAHLAKLEKFTGIKITRLSPRLSLDYYFYAHPVMPQNSLRRIGRGWPNSKLRWCTGLKVNALKVYSNALTYRLPLPLTQCVGLAADEAARVERQSKKNLKFQNLRFPLAEWGIGQKEALQYCLKRGFTWDGLYRIFDRVSCFCCPLGGIDKARKVWKYFPDLWTRMLNLEAKLPLDDRGRKFIGKYSVSDLTLRFIQEAQERKTSC